MLLTICYVRFIRGGVVFANAKNFQQMAIFALYKMMLFES